MAEAGTFCINADVEKKAGANCSATSKAEAYTNIYIQEVEGLIMCECRHDFKTDYATLNASIKELLRQATSDMAAMYVIIYDMSGYTSRTESENMINVLYRLYRNAIKLLKDQKTVTWGT